ncbi:MAG TPA: hypothetical protein VK447_20095 [Myxococcaceae bacterium]|nr:hypothetical protein [Myxococcaceae bacterium]
MLPRAMRWLLLGLTLGLAGMGCSFADKVESVQQQSARASRELRQTLGVQPALSLNVQYKDDIQLVQANVRLSGLPQGMDLEQVRRQVNIIVRKHVKGVTEVTLTF